MKFGEGSILKIFNSTFYLVKMKLCVFLGAEEFFVDYVVSENFWLRHLKCLISVIGLRIYSLHLLPFHDETSPHIARQIYGNGSAGRNGWMGGDTVKYK